MPTTLFSRERDGGQIVTVTALSDGRPVYLLNGTEYTRKQALLLSLTHNKAWSFDRYFRLGRYQPSLPPVSTLDLFAYTGPQALVTKAATRQAPWRTPAAYSGLGIDLDRRSHEVAKLFYAGFGRQVRAAGFDQEDVLQEIYRGILARNKGICPWDPAKSSFGHYVHMVCSCIVSNYRRKQKSRQEYVGHRGYDAQGDYKDQDAGDFGIAGPSSADTLVGILEAGQDLVSHMQQKTGKTRELALASKALPLLIQGYSRKELAESLDAPISLVSKAIKLLREHSGSWDLAQI